MRTNDPYYIPPSTITVVWAVVVVVCIGALMVLSAYLNKKDIQACIDAGYAVETCYATINP